MTAFHHKAPSVVKRAGTVTGIRGSFIQSVNYRKFSRNSSAFAINEIALWLTKVTAGRSDNFAHPGYTSFSPETDVLYRAVLRVVSALDAGRESSGRQVL